MNRSILCLALAGFATIVQAASDRPNLIAIVTDDQGQWAVGAYGNRQVHTPNMDRIGREGALFANAFTVTPVCSPSRASYLSGLWPTQVGITDYLSPQENNEGVGLAAPIWPAVLQQHGYRTAMIGKWHVGTQPQFHPTKKGFDHFMGFLGGGTTPMNAVLEVRGKETRTEGPLPDVLVSDAIEFIRANREQPFAVCLHFRAPHLPYGPVPEQDSAHYRGQEIDVPQLPGLDIASLKRTTAEYYASISSVDRNLGRLLAALDELKLADNTLVVFTSDHGYNEGRHYIKTKGNGQWMAGGVNGPKRPNMWDTSVRVPLLARWPKVIRAGTKIDYPVSNLDTYRTMLGALGVQPPAECRAGGIDYSPLLHGETLPPREAIFGQYDLHNGGLAYLRMVRTPQWKYVKHFRERQMDELYDLTADPGEEKNLISRMGNSRQREALSHLQQQLSAWQQSIDDPVLKDAY
jgi:uncharacterized sulfatase